MIGQIVSAGYPRSRVSAWRSRNKKATKAIGNQNDMLASRFKSKRKWFENCIVRPADNEINLFQKPVKRSVYGLFCFRASTK
jgi:hypothetical protein